MKQTTNETPNNTLAGQNTVERFVTLQGAGFDNWIRTEDRLPEAGKYVLARHNRGTWFDSDDQSNVNCVIVKLEYGISQEQRRKMKAGELPDEIIKYPDGRISRRSNIYRGEDEKGNNEKPYCWRQFGPDNFFGQTITHWLPIPPLVNDSDESR